MTLKSLLRAAIGTALFLGMPVAATAQATASAADGGNGLVVLQSNRGGSSDIYTIRPDGSHLARLTSAVGPNRRPRWSPNGRIDVSAAFSKGGAQ